MMHQKKIAKLRHKVFYKDRPRINSSGNKKHKNSIPSFITKVFDGKITSVCSRKSRKEDGLAGDLSKKTLALHHNLAYVSYSIPLLSMFALLLISGISVIGIDNINSNSDKVYAQSNINNNTNTNGIENVDNISNKEVVNSNIDTNTTKDNENYDISLLSDATSYLSISQPNLTSERIAPGEIGYVSSNVTYSANDIESYALQLTYANGYNSLKLENGTTTLTGAGGKKPAGANSMADNSWGFAWSDTDDNQEGLTYYTMPAYGTKGINLSTGLLENATTPSISNTKKLTFAAKFGSNGTTPGHYKTSVLLSLAANPKLVTYSVTYNANAGTDIITNLPQNFSIDSTENTQTYTIPNNTPTRSGYEFLGWSTNSTATTADASYAPGSNITLAQSRPSLDLYAVWEELRYTYVITFNYNSKSGDSVSNLPDPQTCSSNTPSCTTTLTTQKPSRSDTCKVYKLETWHTDGVQNIRLVAVLRLAVTLPCMQTGVL